ncbi:MAG: hypothetical protein WCH98_15400, partial [Verrucomicrobiota bacterium]
GALWGVFIWKEFKGAPKGTNGLLGAMFLFYILGLAILIASKSWTKYLCQHHPSLSSAVPTPT